MLPLLIFFTFLAYLIKGLTGFGPALIIVPFFTLIVGAKFALSASALFDMLAGLILLPQILKQISWKFVLPLMVSMAIGSMAGARLVVGVPESLIRYLIGFLLIGFVLSEWFSSEPGAAANGTLRRKLAAPRLPLTTAIGLAAGFSGGLAGISGPPVVLYLKLFFSKTFFRSQLIIIFLVENVFRLGIYATSGIIQRPDWLFLVYLLPALFAGLWTGNRLHLSINEERFNFLISLTLLVVAGKLIFF